MGEGEEMIENLCLNCQKIVPAYRRRHAKYCNASCKSAFFRKKRYSANIQVNPPIQEQSSGSPQPPGPAQVQTEETQ